MYNEIRQHKETKKRRPDNYYGKWEQGQIVKSKELKMSIKRVRKWIDRYISIHNTHISILPLWIMMGWFLTSEDDWGTVPYERFAQGGRPQTRSVKVCTSGGMYHTWGMLDDIILFTAGKAAYGSFSVDSSHYRFNRHAMIDDSNIEKRANANDQKTSKGQRWMADTCKRHHLQTARYWLQ